MAKPNNELQALFEDFNQEALTQEREEQEQDDAANSKRIKLAEGKTVLRILPARRGQGPRPWRTFFQHRVEIPGAANAVIFTCPRMEAKLPCPVCTQVRRMEASSNRVDKDRAFKMSAKRRHVCNALYRSAIESGPKLFEFGKTVYDKLCELRDEDGGHGVNFSHPITGSDIVIIRTGTKLDTEYSITPDLKGPRPITDDAAQLKTILETMHDLESEVAPLPEEELTRRLNGEAPTRGGGGRTGPARGVTAADRMAESGGFAKGQVVYPGDDDE
jgi:hypothetical protein